MGFIPLVEIAEKAAEGGYAVPAFCAWNAEAMKAILDEAQGMGSPVILMNGPGEFPLLAPSELGAIAHGLIDRYTIPAALHLDHGDSMEMVNQCVEAGYTSVMLDFSTEPFEDNVAGLRKVVEMARPLNITVEGELGMIGKNDESSNEGSETSSFTDPMEAEEYVERTGVNLLAVSIGNAHGFYKDIPHLDFELLEEIQKRVKAPLVLHGGTGLTEEDIRRGISLGIAKVNVASELFHGIETKLLEQWESGRKPLLPKALTEAMAVARQSVRKWIGITGAAGKA